VELTPLLPYSQENPHDKLVNGKGKSYEFAKKKDGNIFFFFLDALWNTIQFFIGLHACDLTLQSEIL